ncbi:MAG: hypothetical protein IIY21_04370 [Clostridiales bacterium]|nr:hypothetical protein [Clostridiales bacterium]MBQ1573879.1 hypothetical protein [Clostridiales bacterium]
MRYLPILLLALCLTIPTGFALSYDGSAVLQDGSVSAETLSVGVYSYDGDVYTPTVAGITSSLTVTKTGSTYSLNVTDEPVLSGYFIKISGNATECTLNCDTVMDTDISNVSAKVYVDGSSEYPRTIQVGTYYPVSMSITASYTGNTFPDLDISPRFTVSSIAHGSFQQESVTVLRLKITDPASVEEVIVNANEDLVDTGGYDVSTNTAGSHGNNYPAVNLSNEGNNRGGISDRNGQIDLDLTIPKGYTFVMYLSTTGSNTFHLKMMKGDTTVIEGTVTFNAGIGTSGYYLSSKSYDGSSSGYFYSSINNVNQYDAWMTGGTEDFSIEITTEDGESASRTLKMDLVFKKD